MFRVGTSQGDRVGTGSVRSNLFITDGDGGSDRIGSGLAELGRVESEQVN